MLEPLDVDALRLQLVESAPDGSYASSIEPPTKPFERALADIEADLPASVRRWWASIRRARLYEDLEYGQWGLVIYDLDEAKATTKGAFSDRPKDFRPGDLVIGEFLGDSDLLLLRSDPSASDFGSVWIVAPIDPREDWDCAAPDFDIFLARYVQTSGAKYWES